MIKFHIQSGVLVGVEYFGNEMVLNVPSDVKVIKRIKIEEEIKEIIIPSSVENIEIGAFLHGDKLNKITLLDNQNFIVQNKLLLDRKHTIVYLAERDIAGDVNIPSTVRAISDHCFNNCKKIINVRLNDNIDYIGAFAFAGCRKLSNVQLPTVNSIELEESTFENCWSLKNITIPDNVTGFGPCLFFDCHNLKKIEIKSKKIKTIPYECFMFCEKLIRLDFNDGIKRIEDAAFLGCFDITEISSLNTVTELVGNHIFDRDDKLTVFTSSNAVKEYCNNHGVKWLDNDVSTK